MQLWLATPRGFCAGVERAITIVERVLEKFDAPIYVRHEVVHNRYVVENLRRKGAVFVEELQEIPDGAVVIFSAHGISKAVREEAARRHLRVFDATCPLVTKVHMEVIRHHAAGCEVVMIGHRGHPEVEGTMGQVSGGIYLVETEADAMRLAPATPDCLAYVTQTTLSVDDASRIIARLRERFPQIVGPRKDDICYATQSRQDAVRRLAQCCDLILVVGSKTSSNSNRLREVATSLNVKAYLIDGAEDIQMEWLAGCSRIGITAGASAPEVLVNQVIERLTAWGTTEVHTLEGVDENITFALPLIE